MHSMPWGVTRSTDQLHERVFLCSRVAPTRSAPAAGAQQSAMSTEPSLDAPTPSPRPRGFASLPSELVVKILCSHVWTPRDGLFRRYNVLDPLRKVCKVWRAILEHDAMYGDVSIVDSLDELCYVLVFRLRSDKGHKPPSMLLIQPPADYSSDEVNHMLKMCWLTVTMAYVARRERGKSHEKRTAAAPTSSISACTSIFISTSAWPA